MLIELSERNLIYILNSLNFLLRCMEYHYQITDIKDEVKHYFNYDNYVDDYDCIRILHRILSTKGNKDFYSIENDVFFKGQKDYLCTKEKDFKILQDLSRYKNFKKENVKQDKILNLFKFKNKFNFFRKNVDKYKNIV